MRIVRRSSPDLARQLDALFLLLRCEATTGAMPAFVISAEGALAPECLRPDSTQSDECTPMGGSGRSTSRQTPTQLS